MKDWFGRRRAYSQRSSGASMMRSASAGIGTPPRELLIFAMPLAPTNAYIGPIGGSAPNTSRTSCDPTMNDDPGDVWSTPDGSNTTPSYAHRIGQSTFQTSLPWLYPVNGAVCAWPHAQVNDSTVVSSWYPVTVVASVLHTGQYGLYGK